MKSWRKLPKKTKELRRVIRIQSLKRFWTSLTVSIHPIVMNFAYKARTPLSLRKSQLKYQNLTSMIFQGMKQQPMKKKSKSQCQIRLISLPQKVWCLYIPKLLFKTGEIATSRCLQIYENLWTKRTTDIHSNILRNSIKNSKWLTPKIQPKIVQK